MCEDFKDGDTKIAVFVQPGLTTSNKELSASEKLYADNWTDHNIRTIKNLEGFAESLPALANHCDYVSDVRDIFDNHPIPVYWDRFHMTDDGNKIVADRLFQEIYPLVIEDMNIITE